MQELDDNALLREYVERESGEAFGALVMRHVNKVYSVALRHTGNPSSAEEITQAVFVILAQKSRHLGKGVVLSGWLYQTARLTAVTHIRSQIRRTRREQEAHMQTSLNENESEVWRQIAPLLDTAMASLSETDRHAVVLRFFDGKSLREVGVALGANEEAAKKRVSRAVEKLRKFFTKRGVVSTTTVIASAISANSVQAAPTALAKTVTVIAIAKGTAASSSTLILIKGALKLMAWTKAKMAIVVGAALILTAATTVVVRTITPPKFDEKDFFATTEPVAENPQNNFTEIGRPTIDSLIAGNWAVQGLLDHCMEVSGTRYLIDKNLAGATIQFGYTNTSNGKDFVTTVEEALQTGTQVEWWDLPHVKAHHRENLVLIKQPDKKTVLVVSKDKAARYQRSW